MHKLLGNLDHGLLFIVSAPAGTGKTTLVQMIVNEFPSVVKSVSFTTRKPRSGEIPGIHYHFISKKEFEKKIANNEFLEFAKVYDDYYGTAYQTIHDLLRQKKHVILVIDTQGAHNLKGKIPATYIFIQPPSLTILKERLTNRQTDTPAAIDKRMEWAKRELQEIGAYDYCIINDDLSTAYQVLRSILIAEEHRIRHNNAQT